MRSRPPRRIRPIEPSAATSRCEAVRESLSARLDDEPAPLPADVVRHHLAVCDDCAVFGAAVADVHRRSRVGTAAAVPDLTDRIVAATAGARGATGGPTGRPRVARRGGVSGGRGVALATRDLRAVVGFAGAAKIVLALALLLAPAGPSGHLVRDLATIEIALGVGLLVAAVQPGRARGLLPVLAVVATTAVALAVVDVATGTAGLAAELTHLTEVVGVLALWRLARRAPDVRALRPQTAV